MTRAPERWFITTDFFANGGTVFDGWGPFPSVELALRVRQLLEEQPGARAQGLTLAVDKR